MCFCAAWARAPCNQRRLASADLRTGSEGLKQLEVACVFLELEFAGSDQTFIAGDAVTPMLLGPVKRLICAVKYLGALVGGKDFYEADADSDLAYQR